jgi:hypothetical protein
MDKELEVISAEAVVANLMLPRHLFASEGRRKTAECVKSGSAVPLPGSEGNTSHPAQVGGPFTVGLTAKFLYAYYYYYYYYYYY